MATIEPANVHIQLRKKESHLLLMLCDSGLINLHNFQATLSNVFYEKKNEKNHTELMTELVKLRKELDRQILKTEEPKKEIILPDGVER